MRNTKYCLAFKANFFLLLETAKIKSDTKNNNFYNKLP